jgi:hypothetical protein
MAQATAKLRARPRARKPSQNLTELASTIGIITVALAETLPELSTERLREALDLILHTLARLRRQ